MGGQDLCQGKEGVRLSNRFMALRFIIRSGLEEKTAKVPLLRAFTEKAM